MRILSVHPSVCLFVRLSVCLSNAWIVSKQARFLHHTKDRLASFLRKSMVGGGDKFCLNFVSTGLRWSEIADFEQIIARSASAVTTSEKS